MLYKIYRCAVLWIDQSFFLIDRLTLRFTALDVKLLDYVYLMQFLRYYGMTNDRTLKRAQNV